jgi:hypothetical protein
MVERLRKVHLHHSAYRRARKICLVVRTNNAKQKYALRTENGLLAHATHGRGTGEACAYSTGCATDFMPLPHLTYRYVSLKKVSSETNHW